MTTTERIAMAERQVMDLLGRVLVLERTVVGLERSRADLTRSNEELIAVVHALRDEIQAMQAGLLT